jgi:DNA-binding XRE family transcriptional regulator
VLYLIDNKALTRDGNVSSVSALTTNFEQNLEAVRVQLEAAVADQARSAAEVELCRKALAAIENENYVRMVTNANIARDGQLLSGVTERLRAQEIDFLNLWP